MAALGTKAPDFSLPDVTTGKTISPEFSQKKKAFLVMFICRHYPYVQHVKTELSRLGKDYAGKDIGIVAISSNDASKYPDDAPASLKAFAGELALDFPLCHDETQEVAKVYTAACTPDFFLYEASRALVYRGQLDDSRPGNGKPVNGKDLRSAIEAVLAARPVSSSQKASMGCNIKWKPGNEPLYFR